MVDSLFNFIAIKIYLTSYSNEKGITHVGNNESASSGNT